MTAPPVVPTEAPQLTRADASAWLTEELEKGRRASSLSLYGIAKEVGVGRGSIENIYRGLLPGSNTVAAICALFDIEMLCSPEDWDRVQQSFRQERAQRGRERRVREADSLSVPASLPGAPSGELRFGPNAVLVSEEDRDRGWELTDHQTAQSVIDLIRQRIVAAGKQRGLAEKATAKWAGVSTRFLNGHGTFHSSPERLSRIAELVDLTSVEASYVRLCSQITFRAGSGLQSLSCVRCETRFLVSPALADKQFCSRDCQNTDARNRPQLKGAPLRRYLWDEMRGRGVTEYAAMAREWGVKPGHASVFFRKPERVLTRDTLGKIANYLSQPVEQLIKLQGGIVGEERFGSPDGIRKAAARAKELADDDPDWLQKRGDAISRAKKGHPMSESHYTNWLQSLLEPKRKARREALANETSRKPGKKLAAAAKAFRQHLGRQPTEAELEEFVARKARARNKTWKLGLRDEVIVSEFARALGMAPGPKAHQLQVCELRGKRLTWKEIHQQARQQDGSPYMSQESLRITHAEWHEGAGVPPCRTP